MISPDCIRENPQVLSVGYEVPGYCYTQREIFDKFAYPEKWRRVFNGAGVEKRRFVGTLEHMRMLSFQEQQEIYAKEAAYLAEIAIMNSMDGRQVKEFTNLSFSSCTGILPGPVMGHYLHKSMDMRHNTNIGNNLFQGCDGAFPGIRRCFDYTAHTDKPSLVVSCELSSCTYYPEERGPNGEPDPEGHHELLRAHSLFADAAACILIGKDKSGDPRHPYILDAETYLDTRYIGDLGYTWRNGRLRVLLSRRVPQIASDLVSKVTPRLLQRWDLTVPDINYWVIHPAGAIVLDLIRDKLGIAEEKLCYSRQALREFGNCSSATVGIIAKLLMQDLQKPDGYLVMINVGPGMTADATLMMFCDG